MINTKMSFAETQKDLDHKLFSLDQKHRKNNLDILEIADFLPVGLLINHKNGSNRFMNSSSEQTLNMTLDEALGLGPEYQKQIVYCDDEFKKLASQIRDFYNRQDEQEILSFFQRVRPINSMHYEWVYITSKLFRREESSPPQERIVIACPVNMMGNMNKKVTRVLDENEYMKKHFKKFALLTRREREILTLLAQGYNNPQISDRLYISRYTVEQHRKNINAKLDFSNYAHLIKFAETFDLL